MEFRVLGPVQVWTDGQALVVGGSLQRALLASLLLHANRVVAAERLIELLWGSAPPKTARAGLQTRVSHLRQVLTAEGDGAATGDRLLFRPPGYLLQVASGELDLERFRELAEGGRRALAAGDAETASQVLSDALRLWRGRPFADVLLPALARHSDSLDDRRLAVLEDRVEADLQLGRHAELTAELWFEVERHPLRERLRWQQMLALYRSGRPGEALACYRDAYAAMRDALGIDPSPQLKRLEQAILARDPSLDLVPARRAVDGLPAGAGCPCPPTSMPAELPPDVPDFVGRHGELARLCETLHQREPTATAVAWVAGVAGVGKSALAVHAAHRLRPHFPDGQLYVDLQGSRQGRRAPAEVLAGLLHSLGVGAAHIPPSLDSRAGIYRTCLADKRALLLLDDVGDESQVAPLLPGGRRCAVLATSRLRLSGLASQATMELAPLPLQDATALLATILGGECVELDPEAAQAIVGFCGGLPSGIRMIGAKLLALDQVRRLPRPGAPPRPPDWGAWVAAMLLADWEPDR